MQQYQTTEEEFLAKELARVNQVVEWRNEEIEQLSKRIKELQSRIASLEGEQKWISVTNSNKKPQEAQEIWVYREQWNHVFRRVWYRDFSIGETHWQPVIVPSPPISKDSKTDVL